MMVSLIPLEQVPKGGAERLLLLILALACSVPCKLVLFPKLIHIYVKPPDEVTSQFRLQYHWYADDIQLYLALPSDSKRVVETLNQCLDDG